MPRHTARGSGIQGSAGGGGKAALGLAAARAPASTRQWLLPADRLPSNSARSGLALRLLSLCLSGSLDGEEPLPESERL